ncbi:hypothetical protein [Bacillus phage YungSlug]|nr:hypothetical protein [Bacillus phage YungSlug]
MSYFYRQKERAGRFSSPPPITQERIAKTKNKIQVG